MTSKSLHYIILFLFIALPLLFTLPQYGVTFDEPIYLEAAGNVQKWLALPVGSYSIPIPLHITGKLIRRETSTPPG